MRYRWLLSSLYLIIVHIFPECTAGVSDGRTRSASSEMYHRLQQIFKLPEIQYISLYHEQPIPCPFNTEYFFSTDVYLKHPNKLSHGFNSAYGYLFLPMKAYVSQS